jgi:hypothetical protein
VAFVEAGLRRRLSPLARSALAVAEAVRPKDAPVRMVFASRHGELRRNADMLQELAAGQAPSPMNFSLSVLNAVAGLFGIAHRDQSASSALSAGRATVPFALIEGAAQAWTYPGQTVLVICADEPPPELYVDLIDEPIRPYALAVALRAGATNPSIRCTWMPAGSGAESEATALEAVVDCLQSGRSAQWIGPDHTWRWQPERVH